MSDHPEIATLRRRQFLRGLGGTLLALPFLPSLLPRIASAQDPVRPKFFVAFTTGNGGGWLESIFPGDSTLTERQTYAGRTIQRGDLVPRVSGSRASLSPILSASSTALTPRIASKMNVISGFDVPFEIGHHRGFLGNFANNDGENIGE